MQENMNSNVVAPEATVNKVADDVILEMKDVSVHFKLDEGLLKAVDGVDYVVKKGKTLGIVGESGCGKSVTTNAMLRVLPAYAKIGGQMLLYEKNGKKLDKPIDIAKLRATSPEMREIRGGNISMIFQEPMKAFSPIHTIGNQIIEAIMLHVEKDEHKAREIALQVLRDVNMSNPEQRIDEYPYQLSGGMRQRAMIAMALASKPAILIADEPTTALDVTVQSQVLKLINDLKTEINTSVIFITHDLGVIAEMSDDVAVMYLGKIVEYSDVDSLFHDAMHPYTTALMASMPAIRKTRKAKLKSIEGIVPTPINLPKGCGFYQRCDFAEDGVCNVDDIPMIEYKPNHWVRCLKIHSLEGRGV